MPTQKAIKIPHVTTLRLAILRSKEAYLPVILSKVRLKTSRDLVNTFDFLGLPWLFFNNIAASTGVSVNATTADITMELAMVIEN